jgi:hypothetical protein
LAPFGYLAKKILNKKNNKLFMKTLLHSTLNDPAYLGSSGKIKNNKTELLKVSMTVINKVIYPASW